MRPEDEKRDVAGQENEAQAAENAAESTAAETSAEESADERAFEEGMAEADETASAPESEEEYFSEKKPEKRRKRVRLKDMTPEQRRRYNIRAIVITSVVCGLVLVFFGICALCSWVGYTGNFDYIATIEAIEDTTSSSRTARRTPSACCISRTSTSARAHSPRPRTGGRSRRWSRPSTASSPISSS